MAGFIFSAAFVFFCVAFFVASLVSITFIHALFIVSAIFIVLAAVVLLHKRDAQQKAEQRIASAVAVIIEKHLTQLQRSKRQMTCFGAYGEKLDHEWTGHKNYFFENVVEPALVAQGLGAAVPHLEPYCDQQIEQMLVARVAPSLPIVVHTNDADEIDDHLCDPIKFEHWCAAQLREQGWDARTTKGSGDQGVDVIAEQDDTRIVLQCKIYSKPVGNKAVQEANGALDFEGADAAYVVTNNSYTPGARKLAKATGVTLLHMDDMRCFAQVSGLGR